MGGFYQVAHAINDKLRQLYKLWVEQNDGVQAEFSNFDDDTIMKMILTVEALTSTSKIMLSQYAKKIKNRVSKNTIS